mgnify:CR=1 FL=1|tara:strand:- start:126 stop:626 length:501 start_codon:yes stop_codon:yes gene_type:complete
MWIVAKYKINEKNFLIKNIKSSTFNEVKIFCPKIKYEIFFKNKLVPKEKLLLGDYIFFYHPNFSDKNFLKTYSYIRGLKYLLTGTIFHQKEIIEFIEYCKTYEDKNGYIKNNFLNILHDKNYKFTSGPFVNLMFKLIKKNKKNLKILVGNVKTVLNVNSNYHYQLN